MTISQMSQTLFAKDNNCLGLFKAMAIQIKYLRPNEFMPFML
jgi:hypothetical protein